MRADELLARLAERQLGLVTKTQALHAGLSVHEITFRCRSGRWTVLRPGVYRISGAPLGAEQAVLAACLAVPGAVASHSTAGAIYGLAVPPVDAIELTVARPRQVRLEGVVGHRTLVLPPEDRSVSHRVPVTTAERLVVDLSSRLDAAALGAVVDEAARRRLLRMGRLRACLNRLEKAPGRRPTPVHELLDARGIGYHPGDSNRELWVVRTLVEAGYGQPVQQHRVRIGNRTLKLDVSYPPDMIDLEFYGWNDHRTWTAFHADRARERILQAAGWRIIPVTSQTTPAELIDAVGCLMQRRGA